MMWLAKRMAEVVGVGMKSLPTPQPYAGFSHHNTVRKASFSAGMRGHSRKQLDVEN